VYLLADENGQAPQSLALSRVGNNLHIHVDDTSPATAVVQDYYCTPALLAVPHQQDMLIAVNTDEVQQNVPVSLDLLTSTPEVPGGPGVLIIDGLTDDQGIHQGEIAHNGITDDLNPVLHGNIAHGDHMQLQIYANTQYLGSVVVGTGGDWSFTPVLLDNAQYTFTVLMRDPGGDTTFISMPFTVTTGFDLDVPVITSVFDDEGTETGMLVSGQQTDDSTPTLSGTADAGVVVNIYDSSTLLGSTIVNADGTWSFTPTDPLVDGAHNFSATATDGMSETAPSGTFNLDIDTGPVIDPPVITALFDDYGDETGLVKNNGSTDDASPLVTGTAEPGTTLILTLKDANGENVTAGNEIIVDADGAWSYQFPEVLSATGQYSLQVVDAGNAQNSSDTFYVNFTQPVDTSVPDAPAIVNYYDDEGPVTGYFDNGSTTDDTTPTLHGSARAGSVVTIFDGETVLGSVTAGSDGAWEYTPSARNDGQHIFTATATSEAGITSAKSADFILNVDTYNGFTENFNNLSTIGFSNLATYHLPHFDVQVLNKGADYYTSGISNISADGVAQPISSSAMSFGLNTNVKLVLEHSVTSISFKIGDLTANEAFLVEYFNDNGDVIYTQTHTQSEGLLSVASYTSPTGESIASVQLSLSSPGNTQPENIWVWIDDIIATNASNSPVNAAQPTDMLVSAHDASVSADTHQSDGITLATLPEVMPQALDHPAAVDMHDNKMQTLNLSLDDILSHAQQDMFIHDGHQQLAVTGDSGDVIALNVADLSSHEWNDAGQATAGGVTYEVYQHAGSDVELLVQQGVELHLVA
jgi:hypothetical protein